MVKNFIPGLSMAEEHVSDWGSEADGASAMPPLRPTGGLVRTPMNFRGFAERQIPAEGHLGNLEKELAQQDRTPRDVATKFSRSGVPEGVHHRWHRSHTDRAREERSNHPAVLYMLPRLMRGTGGIRRERMTFSQRKRMPTCEKRRT
ncbi:uncharacterized protein [Drosophila virilis]|uniref:uncharacterized protein isoform X1 n=1 Tax=Drosophila virilis TaxID=7244 RepID=UPI0013961AE2|nr:uncharacterized protein LOC26531354 [Drosophila virilis]XP_032296715.1 uncharacterized protein LOC116652373 [Drosophila virilis]